MVPAIVTIGNVNEAVDDCPLILTKTTNPDFALNYSTHHGTQTHIGMCASRAFRLQLHIALVILQTEVEDRGQPDRFHTWT
jgi:hypothetical protein